MRLWLIGIGVIAAFSLGGCRKSDAGWLQTGGSHGRYLGVGIYGPSEHWRRMVVTPPSAGATPVKLEDDQAIIVVVDSKTGEIRACGDLSGYCIGDNPWRQPLTPAQTAPIQLAPPLPDIPANPAEAAPAPRAKRRPCTPASTPHAPPAAAPAAS